MTRMPGDEILGCIILLFGMWCLNEFIVVEWTCAFCGKRNTTGPLRAMIGLCDHSPDGV